MPCQIVQHLINLYCQRKPKLSQHFPLSSTVVCTVLDMALYGAPCQRRSVQYGKLQANPHSSALPKNVLILLNWIFL